MCEKDIAGSPLGSAAARHLDVADVGRIDLTRQEGQLDDVAQGNGELRVALGSPYVVDQASRVGHVRPELAKPGEHHLALVERPAEVALRCVVAVAAERQDVAAFFFKQKTAYDI